jgi:hypothetical protein
MTVVMYQHRDTALPRHIGANTTGSGVDADTVLAAINAYTISIVSVTDQALHDMANNCLLYVAQLASACACTPRT